MVSLSEELERIQDLQRRSVHGLQQVQAHHIILQSSLDKLFQRLSEGQVSYDLETATVDPISKPVVTEAIIDMRSQDVTSKTVDPPLQTEATGQIFPSEVSAAAPGKDFKKLRTLGAANKEKTVLDTLEQEGILDPSFLQRMRKNATDPFEKSRVSQWARKVVRHRAFEPIVCFIILANLVVQGFEIEHSLLPEPKSEWPISVEICFLVFYVLELILRILAYGPSSFTDPWFLMDLIIIVSSVVGVVLYSSTHNFSSFLVIRGFRLLRLGRSLKGVTRFRIVWHLLHGLLNSGQVLLATFSLLVLAIYIAACIGVEIITKDVDLASNPQVMGIVASSFGSLRLTMLTLLQFLTLDSIYQIYIPLVIEKPSLMIYFLAILLILPITLMNLVTAVLVENGMTQAQKEAEFETKARSDEMKSAVMQLLDIFATLDNNRNGALSRQELVKMPAGSIPKDLLDALAVEDLTDLFDVLDIDRTGEISQEEFVDGVLQMVVRDVPAETMRLMKLLQSVHKAVHFLNDSHCTMLSNAQMTSVL